MSCHWKTCLHCLPDYLAGQPGEVALTPWDLVLAAWEEVLAVWISVPFTLGTACLRGKDTISMGVSAIGNCL